MLGQLQRILSEIESARISIGDGWCSCEKSSALAMAVMTLRPKTTLELGVWAGKSCIPLCMAQKETGGGIVYAVDPWSAAASSEGQVTQADREWWSNQETHDAMFAKFNSKLDELNLRGSVSVIRSKSDDINPPSPIDILSLDGNHGEQSIRDAHRYGAAVRVGGLVFVDDIEWAGGHVKKAIATLEGIGFEMLYQHNDSETQNVWGCLQRR